ncbi:transcriptional regulator [Clostridium carboxidivorans P7]|uniref:Transcriptional regulator, CdaR n=1 Tax=Clostridium carboxidivorans P7 TaxID=536227 RepID=C6PUN4_9CLOT|nr:sugar diacid recognition domain-containing protein [Clostridium carboxidivorans]AKN30178.1 transcriptional regulator [Clostridium carboxidivorans P7]EET87055.1 transcriptional regulator, CdaR [Clostridium carboxidivorans P7]
MELSKFTAQKIVQKMMEVIPYNINVMDEDGIIIGSGDIKRVGDAHEGARKAIENCAINEVYDDKEGMKPGVNEPIILKDKVIGVIGITGHPDEVRRFSKLVRVTAVLLIEQAKANEEVQNKRLNMQKFYQELAHRKNEYDEEFYEKAKSYGLDITKKCQTIVVDGDLNSKEFKRICQGYSNYFDLENNKTVFFITNDHEYNTVLNNLKDSKVVNKISLGGQQDIAAVSLENAQMAMEFGMKMKPSYKIYNYEEFKFFIHLSYDNKESLVSLFANLDKSGNNIELIETLQAYIEENGDINNVANKLNIHRNTLNYRLERIHKLTGKNPKTFLELFELLYGLIWR